MMLMDLPHVWGFLKSAALWLEDNPLKLAIAMVGSAISHLFFQLPGSDIRPRLKRLFPDKDSAEIETLQFLLFTMAGGIVAMCLLKPPTETASFLGGFSWYTTLQQVSRRVK
jgi:hypothetical protein